MSMLRLTESDEIHALAARSTRKASAMLAGLNRVGAGHGWYLRAAPYV